MVLLFRDVSVYVYVINSTLPVIVYFIQLCYRLIIQYYF